ncbi:40S ribosomal protein S8 [Ophiocordyceps camponoti-floridani]|uniref:40S ribosomal protein S8 n=1 Tax=Ophiocordyceps camponoti-floridani TaxID=2030778 RepID=A0A8H4VAX3_9HYPO|nr:40S ribosomal protein S8 [Ophiocordyceps camponoti-floridani]
MSPELASQPASSKRHDSLLDCPGDRRLHQISQSWVSLATPVTSAPRPAPNAPSIGRSELSRPAARAPTRYRALRLDSGNFAWASEGCTRKTRVIAVAYHPSNNELVRTNTLTRSAVVQVDAAPFRQWYEAHYGQALGRRRQKAQAAKEGKVEQETKKSKSVEKKQAARFAASGKVEAPLEKQFEAGRLYAIISSRPGQSGRCDGYILEGDELAFYQRKLHK